MNMKKAFTLVELIVVVAIIAILMASIGVSIRKLEFALNASFPTSSEEHVNVAAYMTVLF